jgi:hypothetical protein
MTAGCSGGNAIVPLCGNEPGGIEPALVNALNDPDSWEVIEIDGELFLRLVRPRRALRVPPFSPDARARAAA